MPRLNRRRHRVRDGYTFMSDMVPTDYTFDRLVSKLKEFQSTSDRLRLINSNTPSPSHWARQREREHHRAVQAQFTRDRQQQQAAAGQPAPPHAPPETLQAPPKKPAPPEGTFAGARPPALQSRLLVLDASFNPPTRAHAYMATTAVHDVLEEQRAAVAEAERYAAASLASSSSSSSSSSSPAPAPAPVVRPETRLVLLLAVANADKPAQPAPLEHRLAMIYAFVRHLHDELRHQGDSIPIEMALTSEPFFSGKAHALRTASWYPHMRPVMTFKKVDECGRTLPGKADLPPMEFIVGYDTLVRILDPKYYTEEEEDAAENKDEGEEASAAAAAADQDGVDMEGASYKGKGKEKMTAEDTPAPSPPPDSLAERLEARKRPQTPMMKALDPFFEHASLRVMLRPGDGHGEREAQLRYMAALGGARDNDGDLAAGVCSLDEVGGDAAWMRKVHLLSDDGAAGGGGGAGRPPPILAASVAGVSSSAVRQRVHDHGPLAAQDLVYPLVLDWLKRRELYRRPLPPKGTFADDGGLVEITSFGAWRKEDFCD